MGQYAQLPTCTEPRELAAVSVHTEIAWCSLNVTLAQGSGGTNAFEQI